MLLKTSTLLLCSVMTAVLLLPACAQVQKPVATATEQLTQPEAQAKAHPAAEEHEDPLPWTREQLLAWVAEARKVYKQAKLDELTTFAVHAKAAATRVTDTTKQAIEQLQAKLAADIDAVKQGRYVSSFAGREEDFAIEPLAEARKRYVEAMDKADETYATALEEGLRHDYEKGHIGNMMFEDLAHSTDIELMGQLMGFYWHHGDLETPPSSFERNIQLAYRFVELEPKSPEIYSNAAWLLWSRWVTWKQDPEKMPVGEGDDQMALKFLLKGRAANMDNAAYHLDAAMTLWGLARHHDAKYFDFIIDSLKLTEKCEANTWLRTRCRLTLGHAYRQINKMAEARQAYMSVLEVDPDNEVAKRILDEMGQADPAIRAKQL
jgi:tetratricopeptide (TPR) repeat protein